MLKQINNYAKKQLKQVKIGSSYLSTPPMDLSTTSSAKRFCQQNDHHSNNIDANKPKRIGTHDGVFHCDEILACVLLKHLPQYSNAMVCRTREEHALEECDVVVDVGGVFDPSKCRYDHHQRSFNETMNSLLPNKPWKIKLSSAGLVYVYYGADVIASILNWSKDDPNVQVIFDKVYENFVQEIDAIDNGISQCDGEPKYRITTNISSRVGNFIPAWNEPIGERIMLDRFGKAYDMVESEFKDKVLYYGKSWWPARQLVIDAIQSRFEVDSSGEIIEFETSVPWKEHLHDNSAHIEPSIKFVLFTDLRGNWRVQGVPVAPNSFELRLPLWSDWRGLRDDELSEVSQIPQSIFVHSSGFIGGNRTRDGVLEMARKTLQLSNKSD